MKRTKKQGICEVKIHGDGKSSARKPKICEVKIFGKDKRGPRIVKDNPVVVGMNQIASQVANRLARRTDSFTSAATILLALPEMQAIEKAPNVFKILLMQKICDIAPKLRRENPSLRLDGALVIFIPGITET